MASTGDPDPQDARYWAQCHFSGFGKSLVDQTIFFWAGSYMWKLHLFRWFHLCPWLWRNDALYALSHILRVEVPWIDCTQARERKLCTQLHLFRPSTRFSRCTWPLTAHRSHCRRWTPHLSILSTLELSYTLILENTTLSRCKRSTLVGREEERSFWHLKSQGTLCVPRQ